MIDDEDTECMPSHGDCVLHIQPYLRHRKAESNTDRQHDYLVYQGVSRVIRCSTIEGTNHIAINNGGGLVGRLVKDDCLNRNTTLPSLSFYLCSSPSTARRNTKICVAPTSTPNIMQTKTPRPGSYWM